MTKSSLVGVFLLGVAFTLFGLLCWFWVFVLPIDPHLTEVDPSIISAFVVINRRKLEFLYRFAASSWVVGLVGVGLIVFDQLRQRRKRVEEEPGGLLG